MLARIDPQLPARVAPLRSAARDASRAQAVAKLRELAGAPAASGLAWWISARDQAPWQAVCAARTLRVVAAQGEPEPRERSIPALGRTWVGRAFGSQLRLTHPSVSRRHLELGRLLDRAWALPAPGKPVTLEGRPLAGPALWGPGQVLGLGEVRLALEVTWAEDEVDPCTFAALLQLGHPTAARAIASQREASRDLLSAARAVCPQDEAAAQGLAARARSLQAARAQWRVRGSSEAQLRPTRWPDS